MSLKERVYSVLVVSAAENFNAALSGLLTEPSYGPVDTVSSVSAARRAMAEKVFDMIFINSPLPDDQGVRLAIDACTSKGTVALLLVKSEIHAEIYDRVVGRGVFTLPKPTSRPALAMALSWMASARERLREFEKKTLSVEEKMEQIRLVNRAKWILIRELKMSEPDAHRYIEKQAMDRCVSRGDIVRDIIKTYA